MFYILSKSDLEPVSAEQYRKFSSSCRFIKMNHQYVYVIEKEVYGRFQVKYPTITETRLRKYLKSGEMVVRDAMFHNNREAFRGKKFSRRELKEMDYWIEYLATQHWQTVRDRALARAGHVCEAEGCGRWRNLEVHHVDNCYDRRGEERPEDVMVLCPRHHGIEHGIAA